MAKTRKRTDSGIVSGPGSSDRYDHGANGQSRDRVAARAYELYLERGGEHGRDWDDWLAAERELMGSRPDSATGRGE